MDSDILTESNLPNMIYRGKVRDSHAIDDEKLLIVSTDRISAYDVVIPTAIPGKGAILNQMSTFWFHKTKSIINNHLIKSTLNDLSLPNSIRRRGMIVHKATRIDIECVARGYITGSALEEYNKTQTVAKLKMPPNLVDGDKFPEVLFTPAIKASEGHDENISIKEMETIVGSDITKQLKDLTLTIYKYAHDYALERGIIIADTKLEFGFIDGDLALIDELLTPDSSRFWDLKMYAPGKSQPNYDKQFVRNWLLSQNWNRQPPAPALPDDIVTKTMSRYHEVFNKLTNQTIK
jgi:phosphoribosylaminoimidazole-succinocarboxamide synthase